MGFDLDDQLFTLINITVMTVVMWIMPLQFVPIMIWLERKGSAIIQDRIGPNRAEVFGFRLFGMVHNISDVIKLLNKENITPTNANRFFFVLAPFWSMTVSLFPLLIIPLAAPMELADHAVRFQAADFNVGILYVLSITSMGVFAVILAGWASNNKFSLMGGIRSSAQMISYELSMGLAIVALLMVYQTAQVSALVDVQGGLLTIFGHALPLPNWGVFLQPVAFILFLVASFAETNRSPFDLAEGESELVAGYHVEYSSVKFALFFMAEYSNMVVASFVIATLFFGGYQVPYFSTETLVSHPKEVLIAVCVLGFIKCVLLGYLVGRKARQQETVFHQGVQKWEPFLFSGVFYSLAVVALAALVYALNGSFAPWFGPVLTALLQAGCLLAKVLFFCWLFVWVRWTLPRFRYDQLMNLGWKMLLPLGLLNLLVTGVWLLLSK
jgi:NADH-quinone oxidoreductase subunit H